jgi:hypothetical protein
MAAFDHVVILLSFVYALALTHLLSRMAGMLFARDRVRFSGLLFCWMLAAILLVFLNWLSLWDAHDIRVWTLYSIIIQFLFAVAQYFVCAMAAPEYPGEGIIDMEALYWRARVPLYVLLLTVNLLGILGNIDFMQVNAPLFFRQNIQILVFSLPLGLALAVRARWAQWVSVICYLVNGISFLALFETALR